MSAHKAFSATSAGKLQVLEVLTPQPSKGEVLVKVTYSGLAPLDVEASERGLFGPNSYPYIPGFTLSGFVTAVGEGVNSVAIGDRVVGYPNPDYGSRSKGAQEYALLPYHALSKLPANVTLEDAPTIINNFVCAWWTLTEYLKLPLQPTKSKQSFSDESFVIYGASSSAGLFTIQLLALAGCTRVIAVASSSNHALLRSLGASHAVDYHESDWPQQVLAANGDEPVKYAIDIIATEVSLRGVAGTVSASSAVAILLPIKLGQEKIVSQAGETEAKLAWELPEEKNTFPPGAILGYVRTFLWDKKEHLKENLIVKYLPQLLESGAIRPVPKQLIEEPADDLSARMMRGFDLLRSNAVSGYKIVVKV